MPYRKVDTKMWCDPWFERLSPRGKLGFIYLWTNEHCTPSGFYELSPRRIEFELGYGIDTISEEISPQVLWFPAESMVWVKNFFRHQCQNPKFAHSALKGLANNPPKFQAFCSYNKDILSKLKIDISGYGIDMVSVPLAYLPREKQSRTEQKQSRKAPSQEGELTSMVLYPPATGAAA